MNVVGYRGPTGTDPPGRAHPANAAAHASGSVGTQARQARIEEVEIDLLVEGIRRIHGVDLQHVRRAALEQSIQGVVAERGLRSISALLEEVLHGGEGARRLVALLCQADPFSDPQFLHAFRTHVIPWLRTYPYGTIWAAESGTGADVYALAILLEEAGLYERIRIYATQRDSARMALLDSGIASPLSVELGEPGYREAGGVRSLAEYYEPCGEALQLRAEVRRNIVWAEYDLRAGETFNEFELIVCRNVIPGMSAQERLRVYRLVAQSLSRFGLLVLGEGEKPDVAPYASWFRAWGSPPGLHQRVR
jgi:chemotaxis protein methyltransferase CheR